MTIGTDFEIQADFDIRHVANTTVYTALELHAWLQDLADNAAPVGDDILSILSANPSKMDGPRDTLVATRLNLINSYNIDDDAAKYINFGSIKQVGGDTLYSGLKSIGGIVAASPIYVVQDGAKITKFWSNGHIQILVKVKTGGTLIDYGKVRVFSRKYGQTFSDFESDLSAAGESAAALGTALTDWTTLSEGQCAAKVADIALTFYGSVTNHNLGNGNGPKPYWGKIVLSNGITVAEAAQVLQYMCREATTATFNGTDGWKYRMLRSNYTPNSAAPFGVVLGGKWYVAQGWWLEGFINADTQKYQLIDNNGDSQVPPNIVAITIGGLLSGDRILVGRNSGGGYLDDEYHLAAGNNQGNNTLVIKETIKSDTPTNGFIRVGINLHTFMGRSGSTFTGLDPVIPTGGYAEDAHAWSPFIDKATTLTSEGISFIYNADFTGRVKVRQGAGATPIQPFETTFSVGSGGGGTNAIRSNDV